MDVSVVIPTYNRSNFLSTAISSVLRQTLQPKEVIVVDDGSTDDTCEVVAQFPATRYLRIENSGPCTARNLGGVNATSTCLAFLDSDDYWDPDHLERHAKLRTSVTHVDFSFSNVRLIDGDVPRPGYHFDVLPESFWLGTEPVAEGLIHRSFPYSRLINCCPFYTGSGLVISRALFDDLGGFETNLDRVQWEDVEFTLRCAASGIMGVVLAPTVWVRKHGNNASADRFQNAMGRLSMLKHVRSSHLAAQSCLQVIDEAIVAQAIAVADAAFACGEFAAVRRITRDIRGKTPWKLQAKAAIAHLPKHVALPISRALCRVRTEFARDGHIRQTR